MFCLFSAVAVVLKYDTDTNLSTILHACQEAIGNIFSDFSIPNKKGLLQNLMFCGSLFSTQFFNYSLHIYYFGRFCFKTIWSNPIINFSLACNQRKKFANIVSQANQHAFATDIFQPFFMIASTMQENTFFCRATTLLLQNLEMVEYDGTFCSIKYMKRVSNFKLSSIRRKLPECLEKA